MKPLLCILCLAGIMPRSCQHVPTPPPPADVPSASGLRSASADQASRAAAAVKAAQTANAANPAGHPRAATEGELSVAAANLPTPQPADDREAQARVNAALRGDLATARTAWDKATADAAALAARVAHLEAQVQFERDAAAKELQRQLAQARDEERRKAEAETRRLVGWIFFGGAFMLAAAAALVLGTAASVPFFGPKLAISLGIGSAASAALGVAINEVLANPWIVRVLIGVIVAAVAGAIALGVANHYHANAKLAAPNSPP